MEALVAEVGAGRAPDTLLLCEHGPVYTVGRRRGAHGNVLAPGDVPVIDVERGGDVTWHGPGQLVAYPVVALRERDIHRWLRRLEETIIATLARWDVRGERDPRNTGVWVGGRKIAAIGIACRGWVSWHGLAINLTCDLTAFSRINPCGLDAASVTRLADHVTPCPPLREVKDALVEEFTASWDQEERSSK